ncbi:MULTISPECIES: ankyrin repeat domain-containing protein [Amycolatopsis]|uniref:Ankyrin repeat domain-containing protein n=1 Tax=Amycolatopsis dendrobii TaxID=2760662 RepID=A0A7W3W0M0_9PSEU|nr:MULTISPECIES: ankyrin repeat domain-containing protein [Amycolatopsis]MBB1156571.1 ankyrin repeat domain-containing protein [Amycolatopsis dendrobii]UKD53286.1 ankyrin repeat domain-containing protein [Amycolatopsis sp. FU40]
MRKRKTLPKNFSEMLASASLAELQAVFERTEVDARGGYGKETAIGFLDCPDELIVWLVGQGLDVDAANQYGETPLWTRAARGAAAQIPLLLSLGADIERPRAHSGTPLHGAASRQRSETVRVLIEHGANVHATIDGKPGLTPLLHGLRLTENIGIAGMAESAALLLEAGAPVPDEARDLVRRIGASFEFHRTNFSHDLLDATDAGLHELYRLFDVEPVPPRLIHDGISPIAVPAGTWQKQHAHLWELLVPSSGAAKTMQGEAIRVSGKVAREILDNGSGNWDRSFRAMTDALPGYFASGTPLPDAELQEAQALAKRTRSGNGDDEELARLSELAVAWVRLNATPLPMAPPTYNR